MCVIKYLGVLVPQPHAAFAIVAFGQFVGALGQPMLLNICARLSMDWFPEARESAIRLRKPVKA